MIDLDKLLEIDIEELSKKAPTPYDNNEIEFCEECGCEDFDNIPTDYMNGHVCESEIRCQECGNPVNEWGYGHYRNMKSEKYLIQEKARLRAKKIKNLI